MFLGRLKSWTGNQRNRFTPATFPEAPRILIIRFKFIGDVMLTSVIANTLRASFPKATIHYLMHDNAASLFEDNHAVDEVIKLDQTTRKSPWAYWRKLSKLGNQPYDLIIDAQSTNKSELVAARCAHSRAIKIGRYKPKRGLFYSHTVDANSSMGHKIEERLQLISPLSEMGFALKPVRDMQITVSDQRKAEFKEALASKGANFSRPLFVMAVSARLEYKKWPVENIQEVAEHCLRKYNAQLVLYSGSDEELNDVLSFHSEMSSNPDIIVGVKTCDLMDLAALISHCDLFIGNEGGPRHIAQALNVPSVAVFSPSAKKAEWLPSYSRAHQGVEWDDLLDKSLEEKAKMHAELEIGSEEYQRLYRLISPQPVIELVDDVADFIGLKEQANG